MKLREILRQVAGGSLEVEAAARLIEESGPAERNWKQVMLARVAAPRDGFARVVPLLFAGMGIVFAAIGAVEGWRSWDFASRGIETDGVVVRRVFAGGEPGESSAPVVRFKVGEKSYEFTGKPSTTPSIGQDVRLVYLPDRPGEGQIVSFEQSWMRPLMFLLIGPLFAVMGLVWMAANRVSGRSPDRLALS